MFKKFLLDGTQPNEGALDFSELLDAPAGTHGFLQARDGHLYFEDGTQLRVLGTSVTSSSCAPPHDMAVAMAERLASSGVNMVRMHYAEGSRSFELSAKNNDLLIDYSKGSSRELNETSMERLDFFVAELKKRGVYVQLDTFVGRNFSPEGDELDYPDPLTSTPPKHANIFNRRMIDLEKEYQTKLLTHVNPYTGLRYVDDPVIAVVQIMNENSLLWDFSASFNQETLGPSYRAELKERWRKWLKNKYGSNDALREAWTDENGVCALFGVENVEHMVQMPMESYKKGQWVGAPWTADQRSLSSQVRTADFVEFLMELENKFYAEICGHLRGIGVKCCINTTNLIKGAALIRTSSAHGDLMEQDEYYNHPTMCRVGFKPPCQVFQRPMVDVDPRVRRTAFCNNLITGLAPAAVEGKPLVIIEWNVTSATPFAADGMLEMTAYNALQGWDGMAVFCYAGGHEGEGIDYLRHQEMMRYFTVYNDPAKWCQMGVAASVLSRGLIKEARNTFYICYTKDDQRADEWEGFDTPYSTLPYIARVRAKFSEDDCFETGENAVAISGGYTPTGDFTRARHAVVYSESPYADLGHKKEGRAAYLAKHAEEDAVPFFGFGRLGEKRLVIEDGDRFAGDIYAYGDVINEAARRWGLFSADEGIVNGKIFRSDTGEITMAPSEGAFRVETEQFACFAGRVNGALTVGGADFSISNKIMSVSLLSRDGKALSESDYVLLTAIGETSNEGRRFDGNWLLDEGHAPVLVDQIEGTLTLKGARRSLKVYALTPSGARREELPIAWDGENAVIDLNTQECTIHYELRS